MKSAAESASAADFCNKSATIGVLDAKPLLLRSFWDASHLCGTFGYKVMSVWKKNILPDKISTWRLLQLRRRWQQWKFHQIYCFAEKRVLRGQRGWVSNGKWTAGPPDDTPARSVWVGSCASWKVGFSPWLPPLILSPPPPPSPILSNFKCQCRPPRLVWSASPSGYDLSRYPPVTWWGEHFFFTKCPLRNTLVNTVYTFQIALHC